MSTIIEFDKYGFVLLPTEDASPIIMNNSVRKLFSVGGNGILAKHRMGDCTNQHLYLLYWREFKKGEWVYNWMDNKVEKAKDNQNFPHLNKIILTTDPKLIADGVPAIDGNTKALIICPKCNSIKHIDFLKCSCDNGKLEVNFLTEFCKRWNEKSNGGSEYHTEQLSGEIDSRHFDNQKDNQKGCLPEGFTPAEEN